MKRFAIRLLTVIMTVSIIASCMVMGASAIELKTGIGIVQANGLRLRAKPNTNADVLANASYGDNVVIIREVPSRKKKMLIWAMALLSPVLSICAPSPMPTVSIWQRCPWATLHTSSV